MSDKTAMVRQIKFLHRLTHSDDSYIPTAIVEDVRAIAVVYSPAGLKQHGTLIDDSEALQLTPAEMELAETLYAMIVERLEQD